MINLKRITYVTLAFMIVAKTFFVSTEASGQIIDNYTSKWKMPIHVGDKLWRELGSTSERMRECEIPNDIIHKMSTPELLENILDYPYIALIGTYDNPLEGLDYLTERFNGLREFFTRDDYVDVALEKYESVTIPQKMEIEYEEIISEENYVHDMNELLQSEDEVLKTQILEDAYITNMVNALECILAKAENNSIVNEDEKSRICETMVRLLQEKGKSEYYNYTSSSILATDAYMLEQTIDISDKEFNLYSTQDSEYYIFYIKTRGGKNAEVWSYYDLTYNDYAYCYNLVALYDEARVVERGYRENNCHAYAWLNTTSIAKEKNCHWLNTPSVFLDDSSYKKYEVAKSVNNIAYWKSGAHSALVTIPSISVYDGKKNITTSEVISKWGTGPVVRHYVGDNYCPYTGEVIYFK